MSPENSGPSPRQLVTPRRLGLAIGLLAVVAGVPIAWHNRPKPVVAKPVTLKAKSAAPKKVKAAGAPASTALSAAEELATFTVDPRFRVELMAGDPLVKNPVALAFDPDGRVWVCEMQGYMPDAAGTGEGAPVGRIVILEDTDGDGRFDKSTVFLDHLALPRAIALVRDGALVAAPPSLLFCRDRDGDGVADEKIEIDPKYAVTEASPEHMPNGLLWAMDNWIYSANSTARYRSKPDGTFEKAPTAFRGQWGLAQDDAGRLYYNYHISHLHADIVSSSHYLNRNRNAPTDLGLNPIVATDQRVWPSHLTPGINSGPSALAGGKLKEFTSACGPTIYRGDLFPAGFEGNAFTCEPVGNLIKRDIIRDLEGVPSVEKPAEGAEFLASSDERFRPVNVYTGPDGALWVVDMYQGIVEHKTYMTGYLKKQIAERGLDQPTGLGRIWRVVPKETKAGALPKFPRATTADLLAQLEHPNGWCRDTAQRLLVERHDESAAPALFEMLDHAAFAPARLHALWTLDGLGKLDASALTKALGNADAKVRAAAIRLSESSLAGNADLTQRLLGMVGDEAPDVRLQLMLTLGELSGDERFPAMLALLDRVGGNPYFQMAAWTGLSGREVDFLHAFLTSPSAAATTPASVRMIRGLTQAILSERDPGHCLKLLEFIAPQPAPWPRGELIDALLRFQSTTAKEYRPIPLEREPAGWAALAGGEDANALTNIAELFSWPGKPSKLQTPVEPLTAEQQQRFAQGQELFRQICAACHQPTGLGQEGLAPPLVNSEWALGNEQRLIRVVLNGLAGQIMVAGRTYYMEMPQLSTLNDEQIAAALTYIRREWGHEAPAIAPATVAEIRATVGPRDHPWNARTLGKFR